METITKQKVTASEVRAAMGRINDLMYELTDSKLTISGKEFSLKEWVTVSDYAKKNGMSVARVNNWIARGVIPDGSCIIVPELNYLKLIKDQPYEPRAYEARAADS